MLLSYSPNYQIVTRYKFGYNFRYTNYFVTIPAFRTFVLQLKQ